MWRFFLLRLALAGGALGLLAACAKTGPAPVAGARALTKVVLQTDWYAEPEHGGFYQALLQGYYREAGLDVEIRQGGPSTHPQQTVATGEADFGVGRSDDVILFAGRGIPAVMVGAYMERDPQGIMYHEGSGIHGFKDLDGRNVMAVPGAAFLTIMENTFHIKVAVTPSDFGMSRFLADPNFVQQCFVTNEPYYVRREGAHAGVLLLSDTGFSPYRVWYTRKNFLAEHAEIVKAFSAATLRGWRDYMAGDRTATQARIAALNPKMEPAFMDYSVQAMREYHLIEGDVAAGEAPGRIDPGHLKKQIRQLTEIGLLESPVTVEQVYDARFQEDAAIAPVTAAKIK